MTALRVLYFNWRVLPWAGASLASFPWTYLILTTAVLLFRAWLEQSQVQWEDSSQRYWLGTIGFWIRGSLLVVVFGGLASLFRGAGWLSRLGGMWATWTAYMACVPPRVQNFMANGASSDDVFVYAPLAIFVVAFWSLAKELSAPGWLLAWLCLSLEGLLVVPLFQLVQGAGASAAVRESLMISAVAAIGFAVSLAGWRLVVRRRRAVEEASVSPRM